MSAADRTVRALVATGPGEQPSVVEIRQPPPGPGEVRLRIRVAGVCHSDLSMIDGTVAAPFPLVLGHEAAGEVVEVGDGVDTVAPGDHAVLVWAPPCRRCWFCAHEEPWLCERNGAPPAPRGSTLDGRPVYPTLGVGALADEVVVPREAIVPVPPVLPLEQAALLGCAVLTGFGAVGRTARVAAGASVAVIGLGGVGLSVVAAARAAGAGTVIAADLSPAKEDLARAMGADHFVVSDTALHRGVRSLTEGRGVDHAFECVGRSATITAAWRCTRRGGQVTVVGMGAADDMVQLSALDIFHSGRTLRAASFSGTDPFVEIPRLADAVVGGSLDLTPLITHRTGLAGAADAFARMRRGEGARSIVVFD
jgi:S-(hydroxymethyl)glutathione dehydrogenase / alcohol dehydrogenase